MAALLEVNDLKIQFKSRKRIVQVVHGVSFVLHEGEVLGIAGESGCGKSVTSLSLLGLLPENGHISAGQIIFDGTDLVSAAEDYLCAIRGNKISMIFQDSLTSLNPTMTIGKQIMEPITIHRNATRAEAEHEALELIKKVGITDPLKRFNEYPHQLSGGMRQRAMIAMGLACKPQILIADEPTTALDVSIQAQILNLIRQLNQEMGTSVMLITHDIGVIAEMSDWVMIMYAGCVVEYAAVDALFDSPKHPYTQGLLASVLHLDKTYETLETIEGVVPNPTDMPEGCHYAPRCKYCMQKCTNTKPSLYEVDGSRVACFLFED